MGKSQICDLYVTFIPCLYGFSSAIQELKSSRTGCIDGGVFIMNASYTKACFYS